MGRGLTRDRGQIWFSCLFKNISCIHVISAWHDTSISSARTRVTINNFSIILTRYSRSIRKMPVTQFLDIFDVSNVKESCILLFSLVPPDPKIQNFMMILIITNSIVLGVQAGESTLVHNIHLVKSNILPVFTVSFKITMLLQFI